MADEPTSPNLESICRKLDAVHGDVKTVKQTQGKHGKKLEELALANATMVERTEQHEKRMNRADARARNYGAVSGAATGMLALVAAWAKQKLGL